VKTIFRLNRVGTIKKEAERGKDEKGCQHQGLKNEGPSVTSLKKGKPIVQRTGGDVDLLTTTTERRTQDRHQKGTKTDRGIENEKDLRKGEMVKWTLLRKTKMVETS